MILPPMIWPSRPTKPCVRCSQMPEDHPTSYTYEQASTWPGATLTLRGRCPSYVAPAPAWLRLLNRALARVG